MFFISVVVFGVVCNYFVISYMNFDMYVIKEIIYNYNRM